MGRAMTDNAPQMPGTAAGVMPIPGPSDPMVVPRKAPTRPDGLIDLVGLDRPAIASALETIGLDVKTARMRSRQLWHWIYHRGATDFAAMANIAKDHRALFARHFVVGRPEVVLSLIHI